VIYQVIKRPFHPSTNPEILVKIGPLDFEIRVLESRPLTIYKKIKKNIGKIYNPVGKFAQQAEKLLNYNHETHTLGYTFKSGD